MPGGFSKDVIMHRITNFFRKASIPMCWALVVSLYLYHFAIIWKYAVNVPYWDEWHYFNPDALPAGLTWRWLFKFHNEHRIVFTKLLAWLNLKSFGLDFAKQQLFNFGLFGCLLAAVYFLKMRVAGKDRFPYFPMFLVFLLSPLNYENHMWAFQSQFHLVLLFSVLALASAFPEHITVKSTLVFSLLTMLAVYSFSAGAVISIVFLGCFLIYVFGNYFRNHVSKVIALYSSAISCGIMGIGVAFWFHGYKKPPLHPELVLPYTAKFWNYFLNMAGFGFGFISNSVATGWIPGAICLVCVLLPAVLLLLNSNTRWHPTTWTVVTGIAAILAVLATIAMARADLEELNLSRYNEFAFMLIPFAALAWWLALRQRVARSVVLSLLWLLCFIGYFDKRSFAIYQEVNNQRNIALECIASYYNGSGDGNCPMSYDVPVNTFMNQAKRLQISFTQKND